VTAQRRYRGGVSKFLGFLLGVAVALAGPAVFGVLAAPGGIELNAKELALAFGIGALIFWTVVSYFSGAGALGAFVAFGTLVYCWHWIPNRTTNFLNDVPGVTTGMIEGSKQYTLNGLVPILTVISLVYAIQLIVRSVQRRRRERAEAERLQREQEAAQAQQEAEAAAVYPVAGSTYPAESGYGGSFGNSSRYDDLFDEDPEPVRPRSQADEQTAQFPASAPEQTAQFPGVDAQGNDSADETVLVPTDRDETTQVPVDAGETEQVPAPPQEPQPVQPQPAEPQQQPVAGAEGRPVARAAEQDTPEAPAGADDQQTVVAPVEAHQPAQPQQQGQTEDDETAVTPVAAQEPTPAHPQQATAAAEDEQTVVRPGDAGEQKDQQDKTEAAPVPGAKEQVGQQYRERMEDPDDTGEFYISAFENPPQVSIRPAGA
jgi:type II secretory pathway pseudopilin PulG